MWKRMQTLVLCLLLAVSLSAVAPPVSLEVHAATSAASSSVSTNVALGKPVTVSSNKTGYDGGKLTDGDPSLASRWEASSIPATAVIDLGTTCKINKATLTLPNDGYEMTFSVEGSTDNSHFSTLVQSAFYSFSNADNQKTISFPSANVRYVKISVTQAKYNTPKFSEIEIYSDPSAPDLVVTDISTEPAKPVAGDAVRFMAKVTNQGKTAVLAGSGQRVIFSYGGTQLAQSTPYSGVLRPGESATIKAEGTWRAAAYTLPITAKADGNGMIGETNENNNGYTKLFTFAGKVWSKSWTIQDDMGIYDFPEELISYPITPPSGKVKKEHLKLTQFGSETPLVYQLSQVKEKDGYLVSAVISFRTDLRKFASKVFAVQADASYKPAFQQLVKIKDNKNGTAVIAANEQQVLVTYGTKTYSRGVSFASANAPILALGREGGSLLGKGRLSASSDVTVTSVTGKVLEQGPLFITYSVAYSLAGGRKYEMNLTVEHNEEHILVDEQMNGISTKDKLFFSFSYLNGINPDGRLVMQNGGYANAAASSGNLSGGYGANVNDSGQLPYQLGIYNPNSGGLDKATVFWKDSGKNAVLFSVRSLKDWKTSSRYVWMGVDKPENLYFYQTATDKYMQLQLAGTERHWALGVIPRSEVVIAELPKDPAVASGSNAVQPRSYTVQSTLSGYFEKNIRGFGGGPEVRLAEKLNDFSLNRYKDMVFDFPEDLSKGLHIPGSQFADVQLSYREWIGEHLDRYQLLADRYWDYSSDLGGNHFGWYQESAAESYANSRALWAEQDRKRARALLVFTAYLMEDDNAIPHTSMLGGQPNFEIGYKQGLGLFPAVFDKHPDAVRWKNAFLAMWSEFLDKYVRKANTGVNAYGGRFFENISTYNYASMESAYNAGYSLKQFDGTDIYNSPSAQDWLEWNLYAMMPDAEDGQSMVPPQGAHSWKELLMPGGRWYNIYYGTAKLMKKSDPKLADGILWTLTGGKEGKEPVLESRLYKDYWAILRYDAGGPHEAYLNLQQLNNGNNYRWGGVDSNGDLYYTSQGQSWSWNGGEENGDYLDINNLSLSKACSNCGYGLHSSTVSNVLYDFDFAQYYRADSDDASDARKTGYLSRGVMMLRDDYVSIYDDIKGSKDSLFNWANRETGLLSNKYSTTDFTGSPQTTVERARFPLEQYWTVITEGKLPSADPFSVRMTGKLKPPASQDYRFNISISSNDSAKLWINGKLVADSSGDSSTPVTLKANQYYDLRVDYVHKSGREAAFSVKWTSNSESGSIDRSWLFHELPMPNIYTIKNGPGDEHHIVAPKAIQTKSASWGAIVNGKEYVFQSDTTQNVSSGDGPAAFNGKIGYAQQGELAIFEGTSIRYGQFGLARSGGDFGVSAKLTGTTRIDGRIAGKQGGTVTVTLPSGVSVSGAKVSVNGQPVNYKATGGQISFSVDIAQKDGYKTYQILLNSK
ncbi:PA14 domain-containing protein [Gorillibacterium massiliense]|uniref:PA14 domain-containing protein n=1 Tax=Gorillibacterium massiliense TaxID=1280390 RepID=UPI0004B160D5|nr:PA14 domain-containing protein [Gorillibacterium massiliense]